MKYDFSLLEVNRYVLWDNCKISLEIGMTTIYIIFEVFRKGHCTRGQQNSGPLPLVYTTHYYPTIIYKYILIAIGN